MAVDTARRTMAGQVYARLSQATADRIAALARADGLTGAAWVRRALVAAVGSDEAEAVPVRARRTRRPPARADVLEIAHLRECVAELAGALVQAAILARTDGAAILHAEIEAVLPGVRIAVRDLDGLKLKMLDR